MSNFPIGSTAEPITFTASGGKAISLESYLERNRIVLLFIPGEFANEAGGYLSRLSKLKNSLQERDLKVFAIVDGDCALLKNDYGPDVLVVSQSDHMMTTSSPNAESTPRFILIGKDRSIKLNEKHFVEDKALFATIDAMPMRRAEMKAKKAN